MSKQAEGTIKKPPLILLPLLLASLAAWHATNGPHLLIHEPLRFANSGVGRRVPEITWILYQHQPEQQVALWPLALRVLMERLPSAQFSQNQKWLWIKTSGSFRLNALIAYPVQKTQKYSGKSRSYRPCIPCDRD